MPPTTIWKFTGGYFSAAGCGLRPLTSVILTYAARFRRSPRHANFYSIARRRSRSISMIPTPHRGAAMSKAAQFLTQMFGKRSKGPIFLTQLPNERGPGPHPQRATRMCAVVEKFVETYDAPGYAVYFGVGTLRWGTT